MHVDSALCFSTITVIRIVWNTSMEDKSSQALDIQCFITCFKLS